MIDHLGLGRLFVLGVVALLVFGPERLPDLAAQAGRAIRTLRKTVTSMTDDLKASSGIDMDELRALDPRATLREALLVSPTAEEQAAARAEHIAALPTGSAALDMLAAEQELAELPAEWRGEPEPLAG
ncbi:MAG: twin-arginine translocation protein TatB subunit [Frankiales bacterium]|nr:twin-arginine translocation protein TatB subunit [Frankiales bacterium]